MTKKKRPEELKTGKRVRTKKAPRLDPPPLAKSPFLKILEPVDVTDADVAFPARVEHLMPSWDDIPKPFHESRASVQHEFFEDCFLGAASEIELIPKEGINPGKAWRHLRCIMGSYQPKHEYKTAAVAYLLSLWFSTIRWKSRGAQRP